MLKAGGMLNFLLLFTMKTGYEDLLGLKHWWKSNLGFLKSGWALLIILFGLIQEKVFLSVQILFFFFLLAPGV
jgi:hypothetical protein